MEEAFPHAYTVGSGTLPGALRWGPLDSQPAKATPAQMEERRRRRRPRGSRGQKRQQWWAQWQNWDPKHRRQCLAVFESR